MESMSTVVCWRISLALIACLLSLIGVGCGEAGRSDEAEGEAINEAAVKTRSFGVWRVTGVEVAGDSEAARLRIHGVVDAVHERSHFSFEAGRGPDVARGERIQIGNSIYLRGAFGESGNQWVKVRAADAPKVGLYGGSPLDLLTEVSDEFSEVGSDVVDGVATRVYRGDVDLGVFKGNVELWIGSGRLKKYRFVAGNGDIESMTYDDYGIPVRVNAPSEQLVDDQTRRSARSTQCQSDPTEPLERQEVSQALRENGFNVFLDMSEVSCGSDSPSEDTLASFSNILFAGPDANIEEHEGVARREGHLTCDLRRGPIYGEELDIKVMSDEPRKQKLVLANLECSLYVDQVGSQGSRQRLRHALEELQAALRRKGR